MKTKQYYFTTIAKLLKQLSIGELKSLMQMIEMKFEVKQ